MKKFACVLCLAVIAFGCLFSLVGCDTRPVLGVWWWSDKLGDKYLDFAQENGVTEIYYCSSKFNQETDEFISKANEKGMSVYWLAGEYQWVEKPENCIKQIEKYLQYQSNFKHKFKGIHFDIEPHQHPNWKADRQRLVTLFVELTHSLAKKYPKIWIEYDIPFWLEDQVTFGGRTKPAFQHVMDAASRVTLMSYRDTAEKIFKVSQEEIDYAKQIGKRLNLGVETKSSEGDQVSFMEEGKQAMYAEIATLRTMLRPTYGVVIHQVEQWYDLKD